MRILTVLILLMGMFGIVFAQSGSNNDCNEFGNVKSNTYPKSVKDSIKEMKRDKLLIFTDKDMSVALNHLKLYCCDKGNKSSCDTKQDTPRKRYPESPYIVDQLMYVGMKKLDGNQEHCDILGIDCQPEDYDVDPVEWRDTINEIAEDTKGYPPSMVYGKFEETWGSMDAIVDNDEPTLAKAYRALCNDLGSIRASVGSNQGVVEGKMLGGKTIEELCHERAQFRFRQEAQYVRLLQLEKGRKYFMDNLKSYLNTYFIDSRLVGLMGKYASLDSSFATVLRYVEKTTCCNK